MPVADSIGTPVLVLLLGLIWPVLVVACDDGDCGSAWAAWPAVYVMVHMHALWL